MENNVNIDAIKTAMDIAQKTIGFSLTGMKFEDIGPNLKNFIEKATNGRFTTNGSSGLDGNQIVVSTSIS